MKKVQILIGCSGSGKSTFAEKAMVEHREETLKTESLIPTGMIFSADSYQNPNDLKYTREALETNHNKCLRSYVREISSAVYLNPKVSALYIVDNTNTTIAELAPYFRVAQAFGYDVELVWFSANPVDCHNRNKHGTPLPVIERQDRQIADLRIPPYWKYSAKRVFQQDIQREGVAPPAEISLKGSPPDMLPNVRAYDELTRRFPKGGDRADNRELFTNAICSVKGCSNPAEGNYDKCMFHGIKEGNRGSLNETQP